MKLFFEVIGVTAFTVALSAVGPASVLISCISLGIAAGSIYVSKHI